MNRSYSWTNGNEALRTQGANLPIQLLILPALFDEANRMRRFTVQLMHALVPHGIGSLLPDLPGQGESEVEIARVRMFNWFLAAQAAAELLPPGKRLTVAIRGGALLDYAARGYGTTPHASWRLSPEPGTRLLRDLRRTQKAGGGDGLGYTLAPAMLADLEEAAPGAGDVRTVRLATETAEADARVAGSPLWRRAEPGEDAALLAAVTTDIVEWARACAA